MTGLTGTGGAARIFFLALIVFWLTVSTAAGKTTEYHLEIAAQPVNLTGAPVMAMTINGTVPGPVLKFTEGDLARIHVRNRMAVETSIHWHGILVPPGMDGVPFVSFPPIAPDATFTYEFPIRQHGTYWYHSHTALQEQSGVYGAIVIAPPEGRRPADHDQVVLFSDWTDEEPREVLRTLRRDSDWYALEKGSGQSILGAARLGLLGDYLKISLQRMPAMDIADVAYDRFLANGEPEMRLPAEPGETVLLRIIDGSSTTFFHLEYAGGPMRIVAADGQDVEPFELPRLLIGVAETYDVLLRVPEAGGAYEFRATAHDGSASTSVWIGSGERHPAPDVPRPNLYHAMGDFTWRSLFALTPEAVMGMGDEAVAAGSFDRPGMMPMAGMEMGHGMEHGREMEETPAMAAPHDMRHMMGHEEPGQAGGTMEHGGHPPAPPHAGHEMAETAPGMVAAPEGAGARSGRPYTRDFRPLAADIAAASPLALDGMDERRPWPPYERLRAPRATAFAADKPVREIRLTLDGDMARYVWSLNNRPLSAGDDILIRAGEVVRFIMINRTMMHHPMHLHGHFFRVLNGQGDRTPLKHTVDVAPMSTTVIEFEAREAGDWFFHCHLLYHMESGMARLVHYENYAPPETVAAIRPRLYHDPWYFWGEAEVLSSMTEGFLRAARLRHVLTASWESGWQRVDKNDWEGIFTWDRYLTPFAAAFAGLDLLGEGGEMEHGRGLFGIAYLLPLLIDSRYWLDTDGGARCKFEKEFRLTPRLALTGEAEYDTHEAGWEGSATLRYTVSREVSLTGRWHSDFGWGAGVLLRF